MTYSEHEAALIAAWRGPKCSDRKLAERAGLTLDQAVAASVSLSRKLNPLPGTSLRDATRALWH
jgi:hypothetical protein